MENMNQIQTKPASEEEKKALKKALDGILEVIKYWLTHSSKGALIHQMERVVDAIEEQIEKNEISQEQTEKLIDLFSSVKGDIDSLSPEKMAKVFDESSSILDYDKFCKNPNHRTTFNEEIQLEIKKALKSMGKESPENINEDLQKKARIIDTQDKDKVYIEYDGILITAVFDAKSEEIKFNDETINIKDVLLSKDELTDGHSFVERKLTMLKYDLEATLYGKNDKKYVIDKEEFKKDAKEFFEPIALFVSSRSMRTEDNKPIVSVTENGRYESFYIAEENVFRVRDTGTGDVLSIKAMNGNKIEFYLSKNKENLINVDEKKAIQIGQMTQEGKNIRANITFGNAAIASMFHSDEVSHYLELSNISLKQQRELLNDKENTTWNRVCEKGMEKVKHLGNACRKVCENKGQYHITTQNKNSKYTFLIISKQENMKNANPAISFAFDQDGNVKAINYREGGKTLDSHGTETNHKFKYMQSLSTRSVSADFHRLQDKAEFNELYDIAVEALKEAGIDISYSRLQPKKNISKDDSSFQKEFNVEEQNIIEKPKQASDKDYKMAFDVCRAAHLALDSVFETSHKRGKISVLDIQNLGIDNPQAIMNELVKLGIVSESDSRNKDVIMTHSDYWKLLSNVDKEGNNYTVFLNAAEKEILAEERMNSFIVEYNNLSNVDKKSIESFLNLYTTNQLDKDTGITESLLQRQLGCSYNDAWRIKELAIKTGLIEPSKSNKVVTERLEKFKTYIEDSKTMEKSKENKDKKTKEERV